MSYPHDYYHRHGAPELHNRDESRPYLEPDWHANHHDAQLPALSAIGRGPRGEGLYVGNVVDEEGTVSFGLYSTLTDELLWQSPNFDPGEITFNVTDFRDTVPGSPAPFDVVYSKGGVTHTTSGFLPPGYRGSLVYLYPDIIARNTGDTYQVTVADLCIYGHYTWEHGHKPIPRTNDIVFFSWADGDNGSGFAFGTIEQVGTVSNETVGPNTPVIFTARTFVDLSSAIAALEARIAALEEVIEQMQQQ